MGAPGLVAAVVSVLILLLWASGPAGASPAGSGPFPCGYNAQDGGQDHGSGYALEPGVVGMSRSMVVRTAFNEPWVSLVVNHAIDQIDSGAGVEWVRGPNLPEHLTAAEAKRAGVPDGELWIVHGGKAWDWTEPVTTVPVPYMSGVITSGTIVLQDDFPVLRVQRQFQLLTHEFGHMAGLAHDFVAFNGGCGLMSYHQEEDTGFQEGDRNGLRESARQGSRVTDRPPYLKETYAISEIAAD